jgi:D-alanyl-D-alanine carboxypeptidase
MVIRLAPESRTLFAKAEAEARTRRAPLIEAEHLLLAMSEPPDTDASRILESVGLNHGAIVHALDQEFESSLAVAGVLVDVSVLTPSSPEPPRRLRLSASFKAAMERSVTVAAGSRQIRPGHLLLGILGAQAGTVPRALTFAGVDQADLAGRARQSLDR